MKQQIIDIWRSKTFQIGMDVCRILLLIMVVLIFYKLVTEIEAVKMLNYDPCEICMNKTGAVCFYELYENILEEQEAREQEWKDLNVSKILENALDGTERG